MPITSNNVGPTIMKRVVARTERAIDADLPKVVRDAIDHYRNSNDWLGQFLEEHCDLALSYEEKSGELYYQ